MKKKGDIRMTVSDLIAHLEKELIGKRIELVHTNDEYTHLKSGDRGTVTYIFEQPFNDTPIAISVKWDSGSNLSMLWGKDQYRMIED